jgi:hypothetical protein
MAALQEKMKLILSQVKDNTVPYSYRNPVAALTLANPTKSAESTIVVPPGDVQMIHEQVLALRTLYSQCSPSQQAEFVPSQTSEKNAAVIVHTVLDVGGLAGLLDALKNPKAFNGAKRLIVWRTIREKLAHESHRFTEKDLSLIDEVRVAESSRVRVAMKVKRISPPNLG